MNDIWIRIREHRGVASLNIPLLRVNNSKMLWVHFQFEYGRRTNHYLQILLSPHILRFSMLPSFVWILHSSGTGEKSFLVIMSAPWWRLSVLNCCGERDTAHTVTWVPGNPLQEGTLRGGQVGGEEGAAEQDESPAFRGFSPHNMPHTQCSFLCQNLLASHCPEPRRLPEALYTAGRQSPQSLPRSARSKQLHSPGPQGVTGCVKSLFRGVLGLMITALLFVLFQFFPSGLPCFPCKTSSEMPFWSSLCCYGN